jgi:hypothetical protein
MIDATTATPREIQSFLRDVDNTIAHGQATYGTPTTTPATPANPATTETDDTEPITGDVNRAFGDTPNTNPTTESEVEDEDTDDEVTDTAEMAQTPAPLKGRGKRG